MSSDINKIASRLSVIIGDIARMEDSMAADVLWRMACDYMRVARDFNSGDSCQEKNNRIVVAQQMMLRKDIFHRYYDRFAKEIACLSKTNK